MAAVERPSKAQGMEADSPEPSSNPRPAVGLGEAYQRESSFEVGTPLGRSTALLKRANDTTSKSQGAPRKGDIPYSLAAEQMLLGCVLLDEWDCWGNEVESIVSAEDFFFSQHQAIWRAYRWLFERGMAITWPSTAHALGELGVIDAVDKWLGSPPAPGTEVYLVELWDMAFWSLAANMTYARIVKHYSDMRAPISPRTKREIVLE